MFFWSPHNLWAQKIWAHSPSSTWNLGTKSAIQHFIKLWNFTLKKTWIFVFFDETHVLLCFYLQNGNRSFLMQISVFWGTKLLEKRMSNWFSLADKSNQLQGGWKNFIKNDLKSRWSFSHGGEVFPTMVKFFPLRWSFFSHFVKILMMLKRLRTSKRMWFLAELYLSM